jgi:antitoxin (DNA-binding transcriptional repressor) of toxin-antitoxin stability system
MKIDDSNRTVTVSKVYMHRNMMEVFNTVKAGYDVIVTEYNKPIARITSEGGINADRTN